jgi:hypothetical protein
MRVTNKPTYACEHGQGADAGRKTAEAPLAPRPSHLSIGGVTQNFRPIPCTHCDDGWITQPDGYGCIEWTLCYRCNGEGVFR